MSEFIDKNLESLPDEALEGVNGGTLHLLLDSACTRDKDSLFPYTNAIKVEKMDIQMYHGMQKNTFTVSSDASLNGD